MLDTNQQHAGFYDVLACVDPGLQRAEALSLDLNRWLKDNDHPIVRIAAMAAIIIAYLQNAPPQYRSHLTDSLLNDIRDKVDDA